MLADRSKAWMNPWQNAMLKKQNQMEAMKGKETKGIQASSVSVQRPQSSNNRFRLRDTQSPVHSADVQVETIRELVKTNNNLVRALEKRETAAEDQKRVEKNR